MARLVPCLVALRAEFDEIFPDRNRGSDGWIGDPAHQARDSDHNPDSRGLVHAIDVDAGLGPMGLMQEFVRHLVARCHAGAERRLTYIIYDRTIWSAATGWASRPYAGRNPHYAHAHFSASRSAHREQNTSSFYLEEVPVALTAKDKEWLAAEIRKVVTADADPTDRDYSLGGLATVVERRTADITQRLERIEAKLAQE